VNPFDWPGPEFLQLYVPVALLAVGVALYWRSALRATPGIEATPELNPYEVAHLVGGAPRVVDTALAHLVESGVVTFDDTDKTFRRVGDLPRDAHPVEKALVGAMQGPVAIGHLRPAAAHEVGRIRERLERLGLELTDRQVSAVRWNPALVVACALVFGVIKLAVGVQRGAPVGFLVLGTFVLGVVVLLLLMTPSRLSARGREVLAEARARHVAHLAVAVKAPGSLAGPDLMMAVCLFGPLALAGGPLMPMQQVMHGNVTPGGSTYGNGCGSSCGSGGSGCGGGDGGGGGGCGGCGGGGGD